MPERYDVIVVGTGAGGGALAHTLAPSGARILLLERGDFLPREMANWDVEEVFEREPLHLPGDVVRRRRPGRSSPRCTTSSAGRPSSTAPRSTACARRTSASCATCDGVSPAWPIGYDDFEPWYTQGRVALPGPRRSRRGPDRGPLEPAVPVPRRSRHEPRIQQLFDDLRGRRLSPLPRALRDPAGRGRPAPQHLHPLHLVRRLPLPGPRQGRRRDHDRAPAARPGQRDPAGGGRGGPPGDRRRRAQRDRGGRVAGRRGARSTRRTSSCSRPAPPTRPRSCCARPATGTRTAWPTARTRWDATTCSTTAGR